MIAKDIMHKRVITVTPDMTLREAAKLFINHQISGAPVVSREGKVIGVVSQTDLVREERELSQQPVPAYHRQSDLSLDASQHDGSDQLRVEQVMTPWAISFEEDTPVYELAQQMLKKHIHRVLITRGGELSGIVTSMDMLRAFVSLAGKPSR